MRALLGIPPHIFMGGCHENLRLSIDRAEAAGAKITSTHEPKILRLLREARDLATPAGPVPLRPRARRMLAITDDLASMVAPHAICKKGCSYCCRQAVTISTWEAQRIAAAINRIPANVDAVAAVPVDNAAQTREGTRDSVADAMQEAQDRYAGVACPFLKDDACTIYAVRPLGCRTHFNLGNDPAMCDTIANPGEKFVNFNFKALWIAQAAMFIQADQQFADIREFFPEAQ